MTSLLPKNGFDVSFHNSEKFATWHFEFSVVGPRIWKIREIIFSLVCFVVYLVVFFHRATCAIFPFEFIQKNVQSTNWMKLFKQTETSTLELPT